MERDRAYTCPKCGSKELEITVQVWAELIQNDDGFETDTTTPDDSSHDWDDESPMRCRSCGEFGKTSDFELQICGDCEAGVKELVGCPDGAEICRDCFNAGGH